MSSTSGIVAPARRRALCALVAAGVTATAAPSASASTLSVHATFAGTTAREECAATACSVSVTSDVCESTGVNGSTGAPYAEYCLATLRATVPARVVSTPSGTRAVCAGTGTGTFTFGHEHGGFTFTLRATLVVSHGKAHFTTPDLIDVGGVVYAGHGEGTVALPCGAGESAGTPFAGVFEYARV